MNKKLLLVSIGAAVLLIMMPVSSVIGTQDIESEPKVIHSPLFAYKKQSTSQIDSHYLGKGTMLSLFVKKQMDYFETFDRAISFIKRNPELFQKLLEKIQTNPAVSEILEKHDISTTDFESYANRLKNDHILLEQEIHKVKDYIPDDTPLDLGLNTTNPFAIIILVIVILPIILTIGVMIATMTIITCLNINNCFEDLLQNMYDSFIQGLTQPEA